MKFSEAIAALEAGKDVRQSPKDDCYLRLATMGPDTRLQLVRIWQDGTWELARLVYRGDDLAHDEWSVEEP
jgi:hypothetical protein